MKKTVVVASTCTSLLSFATTAFAEEMITTANLNVREKPSTNANILGTISKNTKITVQSTENGWGKFEYKGHTGYIAATYLNKTGNSPTNSSQRITKEYIVTATSLNVRNQASTSGAVIGKVTKDTKLSIIKHEANGWYKIKLGTKTGFVSGDFVAVKDISATSPPSSNSEPPIDSSKEYIVTVASLNVRNQASTSGSVIGKVTKDTKLSVIKREANGWYKIKLGTKTGFVSGDFVAVKDISATQPPIASEGVLKDRLIILDPGHGGHDPGTINDNGILEKNIVLNVALQTKPLLEKLGAKVVLTRDNDTFISLSERTKMAEKLHADIFLSIHANSSASSSASGIETWYSTTSRTYITPAERDEQSEQFARIIQEELVKELGLPDRSIHDTNFYVISHTDSMPSALTELGFVSNEKESLLLDSPDTQKRIAKALTQGFVQFFSTYK